uniref:Phenylalanine--tRNA ligase beta subunit B1 domain-containing protein n=1 Tax=Timema tahoe TaxID=61484 RepID=A0A7R9IPC0_9NEOP|nr:unnamed protein product [Timema tahoe]
MDTESYEPCGFLATLVRVIMCFLSTADEEFNDLCFEFGLELDEVIKRRIYSRASEIRTSKIRSVANPDRRREQVKSCTKNN